MHSLLGGDPLGSQPLCISVPALIIPAVTVCECLHTALRSRLHTAPSPERLQMNEEGMKEWWAALDPGFGTFVFAFSLCSPSRSLGQFQPHPRVPPRCSPWPPCKSYRGLTKSFLQRTAKFLLHRPPLHPHPLLRMSNLRAGL